jgi:hypothetical protein
MAGAPNLLLPAVLTSTFHRLFGDISGNKLANNADFGVFHNSYLKPNVGPAYQPAFDFDGNGSVNNADFAAFRNRFGRSLDY